MRIKLSGKLIQCFRESVAVIATEAENHRENFASLSVFAFNSTLFQRSIHIARVPSSFHDTDVYKQQYSFAAFQWSDRKM